MTNTKWKTQREAFIESLSYLDDRRKGKITSLKTPWQAFNNATTNGIEWHSTTVIGARPATGKTAVKNLLVNGAFKHNPTTDFRVLEFQFEMVGKVSAIREYVTHTELSYKALCSAENPLDDDNFEKCRVYAKEKIKFPIDIIEEPCNILEFQQIIHDYMAMHMYTDSNGDKKYRNTVITLDHSILLKRAPFERDVYETLYSLGEAVTFLKRKYPIAFIILSQLNRNIDAPERNEDGKYGNYILESDIFGSDALLQHADTVIGLNRPGKQKINYYGVDRYIINKDPFILVMHFLKSRNGETGLGFFRTEFHKMNIVEIDAPPTQERRLKI